jgi:TPR repeat protein
MLEGANPEVRPMRWLVAFAVVAFLLGDAAAFAGPYEDAIAAARRADYGTAAQLWKQLADNGMAEAQNNLGSLYAHGAGVKRDDVEAARLYRAAAEQGLGEAQSNLGYLYEIGAGVPQDLNDALMWYRRGADQGNTNAQFNLAAMYYKGRGVTQDFTLAYMWVTLAAAKGDAEAIKNRGLMAAQMTPAQLAEAQRLARDWKPTPPR